MQYFKTKQGLFKYHKITEQNFSRETKNKAPYVLKEKTKTSYFALCPSCENPIQIIGLYKPESERKRNLYGKHYGKNVYGLAEFNYEEYCHCPYSNRKSITDSTIKRAKNDDKAIQNLKILMDNFGSVIRILQEQTGIFIDFSLAKTMLEKYIEEEGWRFYYANQLNLPWKFAECLFSYPLYKRYIYKDSDIYNAIKNNCNNVKFIESEFSKDIVRILNDGTYLNIFFMIGEHELKTSTVENKETFRFVLFKDNPYKNNRFEEFYEKYLVVDPDRFKKICELQFHNSKRNVILRDIAKEIIEPIIND